MRLSWLLLAYVVVLCGLATLAPFRFGAPADAIDWHVGGHDVLLNLLMMFPCGFVFALSRTAGRRVSGWVERRVVLSAWLLFSAFSALLETVQWFLPERTSSGVDVLCNGTGAALGALLLVRVRPAVQRRIELELSLRLPLSHLFYLITILLVVDGLMARHAGVRAWLSLPLGVAGTLVVVAVALRRHTPLGRGRVRTAGFAACWFLVASLGAWLREPRVALVGGGLVFVTALSAHALGLPRTRQQRFEGATLRLLSLPLFAYLVLLWHGYSWAAAPRASADATLQWTWDAVEGLAAATVLGYALTEASGRLPWPGWLSPALSAATAGSLFALGDVVLPFRALTDTPIHAPWPPFAAALFAAFGGLVYRAELRAVLALRSDLKGSRAV